MHVRWLKLVAFRNHASLGFAPDPGLNILVGPNGHGKTSLLEGLHVLLTGRSFRTSRLAECVAWGGVEATVAGEVARETQGREVRLALVPRSGGGVGTDGVLCPWARVVTFTAADLMLLNGFPAARRAYLDGAAAKLAPVHAEACRRYRLVLHQRGRLLGRLAGRADGERLLAPWDEQLAALGSEIVHRRLETLEALRAATRDVWRALAADGPGLELTYATAVVPGGNHRETQGRLLAALAAGRRMEISRGVTLSGPHRDDIVIRLDGADARTYASRGEQRLVVLALRLAEVGPIRRQLGTAPVLLLDDLLSEFDQAARERVLGWLAAVQGQVVFSTTDSGAPSGAPATTWEVRRGAAAPVDVSLTGSVA